MPIIRPTILDAGNLIGSLPAISGTELLHLPAGNLFGTVPEDTLTVGTDSAKGILQVGSNLDITSGVVSLLGTGVISALTYTPEDASLKGQPNGYASLGSDGFIPSAQLPAIAITDTYVVTSQAEQTALDAQVGDVAVRTDLNESFILRVSGADTFANWQELLTPTDAVLSVNGQTGIVSLDTSNISENTNLYYTQARFDSALAAANLNAAHLTGSVPSGTLTSIPAVHLIGAVPSGSLTVIPSANLVGALPAIDGSALTGVVAATASKTTTQAFAQLFMVGNLATEDGINVDFYVNAGSAKTLGKIVISSDTSGGTGSTTIDLLMAANPGDTPTTLFTSVAKPTLSATGGLNWHVVTGAGLPDITSLGSNAVLILRIVSAPSDAENIKVELYEV